MADAVLVDPAFGTGAVKVTPAHDPNDFAVGERHGLEKINILNDDGTVNAAGGAFAGMDRFAARKAVLAALGEKGLRRGDKPHRHAVGHCQRCDTIVEPYLSLQWFCSMKGMAEKALDVVRRGETRLVPDFWVATWENWLENILDWCISRQLWWGHRIPAFYCPNGHTTVSAADVSTCATCGAPATQDDDVLDTWFSSGLWPISTLGWPDDTPDLKAFYPTSVLITGFDILFFWVARMIMMSTHFTGKAPFADVHLTGLVRDARGQKMSKTKGNVMDPLDLVHQYGADPVRFTLAALASPGRDLPLDVKRMEGYRAFATKLWNAARFVQMNLAGDEPALEYARPGDARPAGAVDPRRAREHGRRGEPGMGELPFRRRVSGNLPVRMERLLRLVRGDGEAGAGERPGSGVRGPGFGEAGGGRAGSGERGAARGAQAPAPGHAVHHRGDRRSPRRRRTAHHDQLPGGDRALGRRRRAA